MLRCDSTPRATGFNQPARRGAHSFDLGGHTVQGVEDAIGRRVALVACMPSVPGLAAMDLKRFPQIGSKSRCLNGGAVLHKVSG